MLVLQQNRNTTLNIRRRAAQSHAKPIDTPKLTMGHFLELQGKEIQFHPPEQRHKLPQPENLDKSVAQPHPHGADSTVKRNHELPACRKAILNIAI